MRVYNFSSIQQYVPPFGTNYSLSVINGTMTLNTAYELSDVELYDNTSLGVFYIVPYSYNYLGGGYMIKIEDADGNPLDDSVLAASNPNSWMSNAELREATYDYENNEDNMADEIQPNLVNQDDTTRPPDGFTLDTGDVRPPDSNGIDYSDATSVIAALASTDTEYASLIQNTISLIQELQAEIEAGTTNDAQAQATIQDLEAQLEELIGTQGAVNLLLGAIDSAAAGTFGDGSAVTFCSYVAPSPQNEGGDLSPVRNTGTGNTSGGTELPQNPFTNSVVQDLCDKLSALSDAVNTQNAFEEAGYDNVQDVINALTAENTAGQIAGYEAGFDAGVASIDQNAIYNQGYGDGITAATEAIQNFGDYVTTLGAYQGGEIAGFEDAINQLTSTTYNGNADEAVQDLYDAIYELGAGSVTPEDGVSQEDVDQAELNGYSNGFDDGVASVELSDLFNAVVDPVPEGLNTYYTESGQAAYDYGYEHGFQLGQINGQEIAIESTLYNLNVLIGSLTGGTASNYTSLNDAAFAIYSLGQSSVDPASGVTFTNPTTGEVSTGSAAVTAAEEYGYSDGFAQGASSVTPEDGISQADVDSAVTAAQNAAQAVIDDLIVQLNTATASNIAYGEFIQSLTSELDILEQFLTNYYGYDPNSDENMFTIPKNVSDNAGYQSYFSGGQEYKVFDPRRIVNMNQYINFSGKMQPRDAAPVERDENLELELTPTAKTGLYILGGGALAFLAFKLFNKK